MKEEKWGKAKFCLLHMTGDKNSPFATRLAKSSKILKFRSPRNA